MGENLKKLKEITDQLSNDPRTLLENPVFMVTIFENAPDAIVIVDDKGDIRLANKQAEFLFGYPIIELIGSPVENLMPPEYRSKHAEHVQKFFADPHLRPMGMLDMHFMPMDKLEGMARGGERFEVDITLSPIVTTEGKFTISFIRRRGTG